LRISYSVFAKNYESWLVVDNVIAIIKNLTLFWPTLYNPAKGFGKFAGVVLGVPRRGWQAHFDAFLSKTHFIVYFLYILF